MMRKVVGRVMEWLRAVSGMPNYDAYCRHMRDAHPDQALLSREQHFAQHLEQRYRDVSRCC